MRINKIRMCRGVLLLIAILSVGMEGKYCFAGEEPPNIVFILVDDLSWSDLGCYGNKIHDTPNINRLAREGMRFTQAYAPAPICSASRAAIMTGKFPARLQFEFVTKNSAGQQDLPVPLQSPPFTLNLPLKERTIAEVLSAQEYDSGFFGKWHISQHYGGYLGWSPTHGPLQQGFSMGDADFGAHPYSYRKSEIKNQIVPAGKYPVDTLTEKTVDFINNHRDKRFFLYLSHYFVHDPIHSRCEWLIEKYRAKLKGQGPDSRASYGAMVETLDHLIGQLLRSLDDAGIADRTLVVFMSDNGGHPNYTTNEPLRGSKWNLYEGGIRVPFIVRWPGEVTPDSTCDAVVHGCDLLPTFAEVSNSMTPSGTWDGVSLLPLLHNPQSDLDRVQPLVWHFPYYHPEKNFEQSPIEIGVGDFTTSQTRPHSAIRQGDFKLLQFYEDDRIELYNLLKDPSEMRNIADDHLDLSEKLKRQLNENLSKLDARLPVKWKNTK
ncbi:sulfatase [Rubinisphaera sp.]|uniref:sulfatase n=1 Tax=Rubinisphaera sp. TaxID=2024857 RepID=UPI0025F13BAE|nr:sulfatase [Rubinisphaera sp.]